MRNFRVLFLLVAVVMCAGSLSKKPSDKASKNMEKEAAEMNVTAADILAGHEQNELKWDGQYRNKIVAVTGVIKGIEHAVMSDDPVVTIEPPKSDNPDAPFTFDRVTCYLSESQVAKATQLKAGDTITVKGKVRGWSMGPDLTPCALP